MAFLWRRRSNRARSEVFVEFLYKELARDCGVLFLLFTGDANALSRLDPGYFADEAVSLLFARTPELETVLPGESASGEAAVMTNDVVDAHSDGAAAGSDAHDDPVCLGLG
jgi:hypothetical protein